MLEYNQRYLQRIRENRANQKVIEVKPLAKLVQAVIADEPKEVKALFKQELIWPQLGQAVKHTLDYICPSHWSSMDREDLPSETVGIITRVIKSNVFYHSVLTGKEESFIWRFRNADDEWKYNKLFKWYDPTLENKIALQAASKYKQTMEAFLRDVD